MNMWSWGACCQKAIQELAEIGLNHAKNSRMVTKWYREFRGKRKFNVHGNKKENLPLFLQQNPNMCTSTLEYAKEHLHELSIEFLSEYIHDMALPALMQDKITAAAATSSPSAS